MLRDEDGINWRLILFWAVIVAVLIALCVVFARCSVTQPDTITNNATSVENKNDTQPEFTSNDWKSWEFAVNGKVLTLPCKLSDFYKTGLKVSTSTPQKVENQENQYTVGWTVSYQSSNTTTKCQILSGSVTTESASIEADKIDIEWWYAYSQEYNYSTFDVSLPSGITWFKSNINEAIAAYGEPNKTDTYSDEENIWYTWKYNPEEEANKSNLEIRANKDSGLINSILIANPQN